MCHFKANSNETLDTGKGAKSNFKLWSLKLKKLKNGCRKSSRKAQNPRNLRSKVTQICRCDTYKYWILNLGRSVYDFDKTGSNWFIIRYCLVKEWLRPFFKILNKNEKQNIARVAYLSHGIFLCLAAGAATHASADIARTIYTAAGAAAGTKLKQINTKIGAVDFLCSATQHIK